MKLSIIIPVFNEEKTVEKLIEEVCRVELPEVEKEIIVVDDGSTDATPEILKRIKNKYPELKVVFKEKNEGKGSAIRRGLKEVTGDLVVFQDADLEYDPRDYPLLMKPILEGKADVVYGSRFLGPHRVLLFWHLIGNIFLNLVTNFLYNTTLTDMETCYKMFRSEVIKNLPLKAQGFEIEPEITAKILKRRYRVWEVPISYNGRGYEEGKKITWRDGFIALYTLFKYRFKD
ncbi:glycosyltransferase family 2 protein [Candidatus Calescamantes bacterium]|nr:glycosyltransferase family 2 protein [Candidatus Calescamantes bacterium]